MQKHGSHSGAPEIRLIRAPAYPFSARDLFGDLRSRLSREHSGRMSFERLGRIMGKRKSTAYHWFEVFDHPHVQALMCLLEQLAPRARQDFIESHCRIFPTLTHPLLAHSPAQTAKLRELLRQKAGVTIVTGKEFSRNFVLTALGHEHRLSGGKPRDAGGLDLHRPTKFVPLEKVIYIDAALGLKDTRQLALETWPKILVSRASLLLLNGVWSALPEVREDLVRCANFKHVVLAEAATPDLADLKEHVSAPLHVLTLSDAKQASAGIRIDCRQLKSLKMP